MGGHQRSGSHRTNANALPGTRQTPLPLPEHQTRLQIVKIEMTTLDEAFSEAEYLCSLVGPCTTRQIERAASKQIANRTKSAASTMLHRHTERIANGKPQQQTAITLT